MKNFENLKANSKKNSENFAIDCHIHGLELISLNGGRHLRAVGVDKKFVDYWPRTGSWWRGKGKSSKDAVALYSAMEKISPRQIKGD